MLLSSCNGEIIVFSSSPFTSPTNFCRMPMPLPLVLPMHLHLPLHLHLSYLLLLPLQLPSPSASAFTSSACLSISSPSPSLPLILFLPLSLCFSLPLLLPSLSLLLPHTLSLLFSPSPSPSPSASASLSLPLSPPLPLPLPSLLLPLSFPYLSFLLLPPLLPLPLPSLNLLLSLFSPSPLSPSPFVPSPFSPSPFGPSPFSPSPFSPFSPFSPSPFSPSSFTFYSRSLKDYYGTVFFAVLSVNIFACSHKISDFYGGAYLPSKTSPSYALTTHIISCYGSTDGQGPIVPFREARIPLRTIFSAVCGKGGAVCRGPRPTSSFGSQRELPPARLVIHSTDLCQHNVGNTEQCNRCWTSVLLPPATLAADNGRTPHYQRAPRGGCCLERGPPLSCPPRFGLESLRLRTHRHYGRSRPLRSTVVEYQAPSVAV